MISVFLPVLNFDRVVSSLPAKLRMRKTYSVEARKDTSKERIELVVWVVAVSRLCTTQTRIRVHRHLLRADVQDGQDAKEQDWEEHAAPSFPASARLAPPRAAPLSNQLTEPALLPLGHQPLSRPYTTYSRPGSPTTTLPHCHCMGARVTNHHSPARTWPKSVRHILQTHILGNISRNVPYFCHLSDLFGKP